MKIAVTYDNGNVFQHFGRTESFLICETDGDAVVRTEVVGTGGRGHEELAEVLREYGADVLICGGLGAGAQQALAAAGIEVVSGAEGNAEAAAAAYLKGELASAGANCDHHDHEEEHACGEDCGAGCGGCSGCHPVIEGVNVGRVCRVHYRGTFDDGTQFDSSYDRGEPIEFICGVGQMISGFDQAVANMEEGQVLDVHLVPEEAYGMPNPNLVFSVEIGQMPGSEKLSAGDRVHLLNDRGQRIPVKVTAKDDTFITFDANHDMAGKALNFRIELIEVK